jgi:hypothetical protein
MTNQMQYVQPTGHNRVFDARIGAFIVMTHEGIRTVEGNTLYLRSNDKEVTVKGHRKEDTVTLDYRHGEHIVGVVYFTLFDLPRVQSTLDTMTLGDDDRFPAVTAMHKRAILAA